MREAPARFRAGDSVVVYRLPMEVFPGFWGYAHLLLAGEVVALVDVGSGFGSSDEDLQADMEQVEELFGERVGWNDITHILITHGHIDHFGGLRPVLERTDAILVIHELDLRVLRNYEERLGLMARRLREYLAEAGVGEEGLAELMEMYLLSKQLFSSVPVDATYESLGMRIGPIKATHVPGHCPGHVVLRVGDILLSGDHILETTTPHQSPERLSSYTGLGHYLDSLDSLLPWCGEIRLTLGGHEAPIHDLCGRILAIKDMHEGRLEATLDLLQGPKTILEVADALFGHLGGYDELLAIEEAGAHVEYLLQHGRARIENWRALETHPEAPMRYVRSEPSAIPLIHGPA